MATGHAKIRHKDLKEPDEFIAFLTQARKFVERNTQRILVAAGVAAAAGLIALGVHYYQAHRDELVSRQFYEAFTDLQKKDFQGAERGFQKLAEDEPSRPLGKLARLYLASAYLAQHNLLKARDALIGYLAEAHDASFSSAALMELASVYEELGQYKDAQGSYRQAMSIEGPAAIDAELGAARMMEMQGDKAGAAKAYETFIAMHPYAQQRHEVIEALAQLGVGPSAGPTTGALR
jgi:predicted negative regulator of RcsB-dependent stress response